MYKYTTVAKVENYLLTDIAEEFKPQVEDWILSIGRYIFNYTGRHFEPVSELRKFDGNGKDYLLVDDLIKVNSLKFIQNTSTVTLSESDYFLYQNSNSNLIPYNRIVTNPYGNHTQFSRGMQNIHIDADWGYSVEVPKDIELIATKLVCAIINTGRSEGMKSFTEGDMTINYESLNTILNGDLNIKTVLDLYKIPKRISGFNVQRI